MSTRRALRSERGFGVFRLGYSVSVLGGAFNRTTLVWYVFDLTGAAGIIFPEDRARQLRWSSSRR